MQPQQTAWAATSTAITATPSVPAASGRFMVAPSALAATSTALAAPLSASATSVGYSSTPRSLPPGLRCRYTSERYGWLTCQILRVNHSDGTYDLDIAQRVSSDKLAPAGESQTGLAGTCIWPRGTPVSYHSRTTGEWLPTEIQSYNVADATYTLGIREHAAADRIRGRSVTSGVQAQPPFSLLPGTMFHKEPLCLTPPASRKSSS